MKDIYSLRGQHRYDRMYGYVIKKTRHGIVYDIYDPETGKHYVPYRKSKVEGKKPYRLIGKTAGYVATEFYKGNITLVWTNDPDVIDEEPF